MKFWQKDGGLLLYSHGSGSLTKLNMPWTVFQAWALHRCGDWQLIAIFSTVSLALLPRIVAIGTVLLVNMTTLYNVQWLSFLMDAVYYSVIDEYVVHSENYSFVIISAKWMKWMAVIMCSFDVCLSVCAQQTGQSDQFKIAPKRLKLWTLNLTSVFPGTVRTWPLKIFAKRRRL